MTFSMRSADISNSASSLSLLVMTRTNGALALTRSSAGLKWCWSSTRVNSGGVSAAAVSTALRARDSIALLSSHTTRRTGISFAKARMHHATGSTMLQLYMILKIIFKIILQEYSRTCHYGAWDSLLAPRSTRSGGAVEKLWTWRRRSWRLPRIGWYHLLPRWVQGRVRQHAAAVSARPQRQIGIKSVERLLQVGFDVLAVELQVMQEL